MADITKINLKGTLLTIKDQYAYHNGDLATVATSGSYDDLSDKPTIPTSADIDAAKPLVVTLSSSDGGNTISCDKTNAEIYAASQSGRDVIVYYGTYQYRFSEISEDYAIFTGVDWDQSMLRQIFEIKTIGNIQTVNYSSASYEPSLTFDNLPTANSNNPVKSGGVYSALEGKAGLVQYQHESDLLDNTSQSVGTLGYEYDNERLYFWDNANQEWRQIAETTDLSSYVPTSRRINNKPLSSNITLNASDVGALPASTTIPTKVSDLTNDSGFTSNTGTVTGISVNGGTAQQPTNGVVNLTVATGGDNDIVGISDGTAGDGAVIFTKRNGDTITLNLNHVHPQYLKYELLADEAAYTALTTKDSSTLYLIPVEE